MYLDTSCTNLRETNKLATASFSNSLCKEGREEQCLICFHALSKFLANLACNTLLVASFPGPRPAFRFPYCKRRKAGRGPGNEATLLGTVERP